MTNQVPQKGYRAGVYRLVSGTVVGDVWTPDSGSGIPQQGFNRGVMKTVTVSINPDDSTTPSSDDSGIYRTVNGSVTNNVYSVSETPEEGFIPGIFRSAPDGSAEPREGFISGQAGIVIGSISGGKWKGQVVINSASTTDLAGGAAPRSITFTLSGCLYVTGSNANSLVEVFRYYLNGNPISTGTPISDPLTNNPLAQAWAITFVAGAISAARGSGVDNWIDGDNLTMELTAGFAPGLQVRPDCVFANIDEANDLVASPISTFNVTNLYDVPVALSAVVTSATPSIVTVTFNQVMSSPVLGADVGVTIGARTITPIAAGTYTKTIDYTVSPAFIGGQVENWVYVSGVGDLERDDTSIALASDTLSITNQAGIPALIWNQQAGGPWNMESGDIWETETGVSLEYSTATPYTAPIGTELFGVTQSGADFNFTLQDLKDYANA